MKNCVRDLPQAVQRRFICPIWKQLPGIGNSLSEVFAACPIVVAEHHLHDRSHQGQCSKGRAKYECLVGLPKVLVDRKHFGLTMMRGDVPGKEHEGHECPSPEHATQIQPG